MVREARKHLLEAVSDFDDKIMEMYLNDEEIPVEEIKIALRKATIANRVTPVLLGTSLRNKGVQRLLDAVIDYLPAPTDIIAVKGDPLPYIHEREHVRFVMRAGVVYPTGRYK